MMYDIRCSDPLHAARKNQPDWQDLLGQSSIAGADGCRCPACDRLTGKPTLLDLAQSAVDDGAAFAIVLRSLAALVVQQLNVLRGQVVNVQPSSWNPGTINNNAAKMSPPVTMGGVQFGDSVDVSAPYSLQGIIATAFVAAADPGDGTGKVQVVLLNVTGAAISLGNGPWKIVVRRHMALPDIPLADVRLAMKQIIANGLAN